MIQECKRENIPIVLNPPLLSEMIETWEAVFITSTSRLVLEVDEIRHGGETKRFRTGSHPIVQNIERLVLKGLDRRSKKIVVVEESQ